LAFPASFFLIRACPLGGKNCHKIRRFVVY
jgi:hypothetical protein